MKTILVVLATLITSLCLGQAKQASNTTKAQQEILAIEDRWVEILKSNDNNALADIMEKGTTNNFTGVAPNGNIIDKATYLTMFRSRKEKGEPMETLKQEERSVEVYGDAAVLSAKLLIRPQEEAKAGKAPIAYRMSRFYVKENGDWKIVRYQLTPIASQ